MELSRGIVTIVLLAVLATAAVTVAQVFFDVGGNVPSAPTSVSNEDVRSSR